MAKTRYAIVKVNNHCPSRFVDNVRNEYVCKTKQARGGYLLNCNGCRYGDTKEQLIMKVEQVIFRIFKDYNGFVARYLTPHLVSFAYKIAKEIVEFLGVEE